MAAFRSAAKAAIEGALAAGVSVSGIDKDGRPVEQRIDGSVRPFGKRIRRRKTDIGQG